MGSEKDINGVVYFWQWLLYTHVIGVVESPTTVYMRDDWEKLSDEKSSLRACRRRIPNRSRVVSCESRIVHMFYYLCLYSLHLLHRTLYRRTHILPLFCASLSFNYKRQWFYTIFLFFALQMSIPPQLSPPQYISKSSRQKSMLEYLDNWNTITNTIFVYWQYNTIQYLQECNRSECRQPDACTWAGLIIVTIYETVKMTSVSGSLTLNTEERNENFKKQRSLRVQTSCKDFRSDCRIQQPETCTWAELKFKLWRGNYQKFPCRISFKFAWEVPTVDLWRVANFRKKST